jgi:hypothetical protein
MRNCQLFKSLAFCISILLLCNATLTAQNTWQNRLIPIDTLASKLESKRNVSIYYQSDWFQNKNFHISILDNSVDEIISILKNACNCSFVKIDSSSFVFVPNDVAVNNGTSDTNGGIITIGNAREYGKYSKAVLNGKIVDGKTGEPLAGARIFIEKTKTGAVTDKNGNLTMTLPVGDYEAKFTYIGYEDTQTKIRVIGNGSATFEIIEKSIGLNEVDGQAQNHHRDNDRCVDKLADHRRDQTRDEQDDN